MDDLRAKALKNAIDEQFAEKKDVFLEEIMEGCEYTDSAEKIYSKMIFNAVRISTRLSVGIVIDMMTEFGLMEAADEDYCRKSIWGIVK
ncbi:hypothetical protein D5278_09490 [bacterium 1XD21-13]|nr:hypothetical protein [bacterium 1XD21-13]